MHDDTHTGVVGARLVDLIDREPAVHRAEAVPEDHAGSVELDGGELRTAYFETGYDLNSTKKVEEDWLRDNAIGRHSFVAVDPPREVAPEDLGEYVRRELLGE